MNFNQDCKIFFKSKIFSAIILGIAILICTGFVFQVGKFVGLKKAQFSCGLGDNYSKIFGDRDDSMMGGIRGGRQSPDAFGSTGRIIKINLPNIIIEDRANVEKLIVMTDDTLIRKLSDEVKSTDLRVGDFIVVLGAPDEKGRIEAKLIRIMPDPSLMMGTSSNQKIK